MATTDQVIEDQAPEQDSIPFYPDHVRTELRVAYVVLAIVVVVGIVGQLIPVGLGDPADPLNTPAHVKPEWYFLALYQVLKFVPKTAGVVLPIVGMLLLTIWPFIDRRPDDSPRARRVRFIVVAVLLVISIALTLWGEWS
jgi:quinol-cytochrome oxidoreductase complex cytochrome b subunit